MEMMACQWNLPLPFSDASRLIGHESKAAAVLSYSPKMRPKRKMIMHLQILLYDQF